MTFHDDNKLQRMEVLRIMADQQWRTLPQLSSALGNRYMTHFLVSTAARFQERAVWQLSSRAKRLVPGSDRLYEYRVLPPDATSNQDAMPVGVVRSEQKRSAGKQITFSRPRHKG